VTDVKAPTVQLQYPPRPEGVSDKEWRAVKAECFERYTRVKEKADELYLKRLAEAFEARVQRILHSKGADHGE